MMSPGPIWYCMVFSVLPAIASEIVCMNLSARFSCRTSWMFLPLINSTLRKRDRSMEPTTCKYLPNSSTTKMGSGRVLEAALSCCSMAKKFCSTAWSFSHISIFITWLRFMELDYFCKHESFTINTIKDNLFLGLCHSRPFSFQRYWTHGYGREHAGVLIKYKQQIGLIFFKK